MAVQRSDNAIRALIAGLAAISVLLIFVLWQSVDTTIRVRTEQARVDAERVDALAVARAVEHGDTPLARVLEELDVAVAAAVYSAEGERTAIASAGGGESLADALSQSVPRPAESGAMFPARVTPAPPNVRIFLVRLADNRSVAIAEPDAPAGSWANTVAAYQALTLLVVLAAIGFLVIRMRRLAGARASAPSQTGSQNGANREADFVVETFHSVIGELQHKGKELEMRSQVDRARAERSERFSERVIAQMPTGLVVIDAAGRVTAANRAARELFPDLPSARNVSVTARDAFRDAGELGDLVDACLRDAEAFQRREVLKRSGTGDATPRCIGVSVSPISDGSGSADVVLVLMTDLTEVVGLRERLRLQENLANLGEMAAGLAHELKNSLATIQGFTQLIAELAPDKATESSDALLSEVAELSQMVTDFLNFARPADLVVAPIAVVDMVDAVVAKFESRCGDLRIRIEREVDASRDLVVRGDEALLGRAVLNLVQNSIDALDGGGTGGRITVGVREAPGGWVCITVADNGKGIPREDVAKIFIPFYTTRARGYGIGLALTQKIVLAHGGRIEVDDAAPGAIFRCFLPR